MAPRSFSTVVLVGIMINLIGIGMEIGAQQTASSVYHRERNRGILAGTDAEIRKALLDISTGKLPPNDDKLIELIVQNVREVAAKAIQPTAGIEAAARQAQEAVSEVTAAYTAVIFKAGSIRDAEILFRRYQETVDKIVQFARSGNFFLRQ